MLCIVFIDASVLPQSEFSAIFAQVQRGAWCVCSPRIPTQ